MSRYQPYPEYKDSGVEWIGEVPAHWASKRVGHFVISKGGGTPQRDNAEFWDGDIPWVTPKDMKTRMISTTQDSITEAGLHSSSAQWIPPWHVLLVMRSGILRHTLPSALNNCPVTVNQDIRALDVSRGFSPQYFQMFIDGMNRQLLYAWSKQGVTVESLESDLIDQTFFPTPPRDEQLQIVAFLNRETTRIDTLIEKKQRFIELLEEKRQAVITHAVTKGLDPNVPMKDSGVEWIGEVPAHWEVKKLKRICQMESGDFISPYDIDESGDFPVIGGNGRRGYTSAYNRDGFYPVIGRQGALCGNITYSIGKVWASEHAVVVEPDADTDSTWLGEKLRSMNLNQYSLSAAQPGLSVQRIINLMVSVPPKTEQIEIATRLRKRTQEIDTLIEKTWGSIELLKERRSALITAAVTGKIDVREEAA